MNLLKPAYTLFLKTGPACNAGCISCPSGRKAPGDTEKIPLMNAAVFSRILDRITAQAKVISAVLHYYNEPTMNPHMPEIISIAKRKGVPTLMSTNGSYPKALAECMAAGLDNLIFSVSGWTQAVHERSHKHTDIELIKDSMRATSRELKPGQFVRVGWHDYKYNESEQPRMERFSNELGFKFTPYHTSVLPLDVPIAAFTELYSGRQPEPHPAERDIQTPLAKAAKMCLDRKHFTCIYQQRMVAVDGNGILYSCAAQIAAHNARGSVFDVDLEAFNRRRLKDPHCMACKAVGGHVYGMQKYHAGLGPVAALGRKAEDTWRALGLGARFPKLTKTVAAMMYERPGKDVVIK